MMDVNSGSETGRADVSMQPLGRQKALPVFTASEPSVGAAIQKKPATFFVKRRFDR
jgi:hypothetical protein